MCNPSATGILYPRRVGATTRPADRSLPHLVLTEITALPQGISDVVLSARHVSVFDERRRRIGGRRPGANGLGPPQCSPPRPPRRTTATRHRPPRRGPCP